MLTLLYSRTDILQFYTCKWKMRMFLTWKLFTCTTNSWYGTYLRWTKIISPHENFLAKPKVQQWHCLLCAHLSFLEQVLYGQHFSKVLLKLWVIGLGYLILQLWDDGTSLPSMLQEGVLDRKKEEGKQSINTYVVFR